MTEEKQAAAESGAEQQFLIQRTYLKDMSLECPMGAEAFVIEQQPEINQNLETKIQKVADNMFEVVLKLTITAAAKEKTVFLVEVQQAGLFLVSGFDDTQSAHVLNVVCPQILFPYARETIDTALVKATFPPLMLPPINFEMLYMKSVAEQKAQSH